MVKKLTKKYKFATIATDVVIFTIKDEKPQVLLIKMKKKPFADSWAVPGGLVHGDESVDRAARRHLFSKTGLKDVYLEQLYTFGSVDRDPFGRVVSVAYFALIPNADLKLKTTSEYAGVQWCPVDKLPKLAYDHKEVVSKAVERLQAKLGYTNIVFGLLPPEFTLSELQKTYEIILGKKLDKRNFRKKLFSLKLVQSTGGRKAGDANRPAELYRFASKHPQLIEIL
ncbi:MAG: NUDIX domain-containing protein [Patescibacteria group bacterium]|jgi:8-oxo-dGTP diphosphatase